MVAQTVPGILKELWQVRFFVQERNFREIRDKLTELGFNPDEDNLRMGLLRAKYLTRRGSRSPFRYVQKYASEKADVDKDVLPEELIIALGSDFKIELDDLRLCYGRSGTCTAFLLRKILEKLIFITFAKNGLEEKLRDENKDLLGLKAMLKNSETCKVQGKPFLMPKTSREIDGIKFLGDTSAHNPLVNVSMETIVPVMPFIVTAYSELSKKL
jgi:hypothetical protein